MSTAQNFRAFISFVQYRAFSSQDIASSSGEQTTVLYYTACPVHSNEACYFHYPFALFSTSCHLASSSQCINRLGIWENRTINVICLFPMITFAAKITKPLCHHCLVPFKNSIKLFHVKMNPIFIAHDIISNSCHPPIFLLVMFVDARHTVKHHHQLPGRWLQLRTSC